MENQRKALLPNLKPFAMLVYSSLILIIIGLAFQLVGILLSTLIFKVSVFELSNIQGDMDQQLIAAVKFLQIFGALGTFVFASFFVSFLYTGSWTGFFKFGKNIHPQAVILVVLMMIVVLPLVNFLTELNSRLEIPFDKIENYFRGMDENVESLMGTLVQAKSPGALLVNLFMIAIIPALGEELVFRGLIQKHLTDLFKKPHLAIFTASVLFSLAHFQVYSFLPRFVLGMLLGYLFYYGKSLWYPVLAHLMNNTMGVVFYYISGRNVEDATSLEKIDSVENLGTMTQMPLLTIGSLVLLIFLLLAWIRLVRSNASDESARL